MLFLCYVRCAVNMFIISNYIWCEGIVLCLFNFKFFVQLDKWFIYLIYTVSSVVYYVFFIVL
jgi:hypothetical protein